eukprot:328487-Pyramimonas_sp.AAC.1
MGEVEDLPRQRRGGRFVLLRLLEQLEAAGSVTRPDRVVQSVQRGGQLGAEGPVPNVEVPHNGVPHHALLPPLPNPSGHHRRPQACEFVPRACEIAPPCV